MNDFINISLLGIFLRWTVSLFPYSGAGKPPMYGDYEAQRHWQEITVNLPIKEWYSNSANNDLLYWGLDYPPLTAYHSFLCGLIAKFIEPDFVKLYYSRGYESHEHKLFMRYSVLVMDLLIYIPGAFLIARSNEDMYKCKSGILTCFTALILYPGLYLIDYGHFQYNNVSLGLFIIAVACIFRNQDHFSAIFFSLALNYKQMELYHALPFFFYLLGKAFREKTYVYCFKKLVTIGVCVIGTFIICWIPFLTNIETLQQVVSRIFPVGRGLFEDKVASFWCSISIFFKLKLMFDNATMAMICLIITGILVLPSCIHLLVYPKPNIFKYSLINIAFIFFLFSFHVHEKSILLVAIPACLVFSEEPLIVSWFFVISIFSMLPLLIKDGLLIPALSFAFLSYFFYRISSKNDVSKFSFSRMSFCKHIFYFSLIGVALLSLAMLIIPPPARYPDLYPVLISFYSCMHFCLFCVYFHYCQFSKINYENIKRKKI
ncbi:UNVERIFIED_CONTAM: hypothetical protein GTU68_056009 [Idotea baltica]|nr:hypothetical protein [Idotea baltica]